MEESSKEADTLDIVIQNRKYKKKEKCNKMLTNGEIKSDVSLLNKYKTKLERCRQRMAKMRSNETPEKHMARLERARIRAARVRKAETPEQRRARLDRARMYKMQVRMNETPEQRMARLENARNHMNQIRMRETQEQRIIRLEQIRIHNQYVRQNETPAQRNARLEAARRYMAEMRKNGPVNRSTQKIYKSKIDGEEINFNNWVGCISNPYLAMDINLSEKYSDVSTDYSGDLDSDHLSELQVETCLQEDINFKDCKNPNEDMGNMKNKMEVLISEKDAINNNVNDGTDLCKNLNEPHTRNITNMNIQFISKITNSEEVSKLTYRDQSVYDFQLNSITGNILPLEQEVTCLLGTKKSRLSRQNEYECPKCTKVYRYAHSLRKHLNVHDTIN